MSFVEIRQHIIGRSINQLREGDSAVLIACGAVGTATAKDQHNLELRITQPVTLLIGEATIRDGDDAYGVEMLSAREAIITDVPLIVTVEKLSVVVRDKRCILGNFRGGARAVLYRSVRR